MLGKVFVFHHGVRSAGLFILLAAALCLAACAGSQPDSSMIVDGIDLGEVLDGLQARTQRALSRIQGAGGAKSVRKDLERINQDYDDLIYHLPRLSAEGRAAMSQKSARALQDMRGLARRIYEMPILHDVLGKTLAQMVERLETVSSLVNPASE